MKNLTLEQHRARIENINSAEARNKKYHSRKRIHDYIPGQATYHLGNYPEKFSIAPTEYDYKLLGDLAKAGVKLIQVHEEWNDSIRHLGADKYSSHDPEGMQKFVDLCHELGIKIIPYISTGFFHEFDPDFTEKFCRIQSRLRDNYFSYRVCYAGSPEWREYVLPRTFAAMEKYGFDGIYNDWGYDGRRWARFEAIKRGEILKEVPYDPMVEDLLCTVYGEVKKRGGIYKVHADRNDAPPVKDKVYDYLWIGECVADAEIGAGKDHPDFVVPCPDFARGISGSYEVCFAKTIPFMQFPLFTCGRPLTGETITQNVQYWGDKHNPQGDYAFNYRVWKYMQEHPNGPYVYSLWSSIPSNPDEFPIWSKYFALYQPMVEENSIAYIELRECDDILSEIPDAVYASMFVNEEKYLVVSNFTGKDYELKLADAWTDRQSNERKTGFIIPNETILFLKK